MDEPTWTGMDTDGPVLYTTSEVAGILRIKPATVTNYIATGKLHGVKVGTYWRVPAAELHRYIERNTSTTHTPGTIEPRRTNRRRRVA